MQRLAATAITTLILLAPLAAGAQQIDPHTPKEAVETARQRCLDEHRGEDLGPLSVDTLCELRAWALLGRHYPTLAERALEAERRANERTSKLNEVRKQLRREREHADELSKQLGKQSAKLDRLESRWPTWVSWTATAAAALAGGALTYGVSKLLP
jgi:hypothetical protein